MSRRALTSDNDTPFQRAVKEIQTLSRELHAERKAHAETKSELREATQPEPPREPMKILTRICPACAECYPDGPLYFPGYLSDGNPSCAVCLNVDG